MVSPHHCHPQNDSLKDVLYYDTGRGVPQPALIDHRGEWNTQHCTEDKDRIREGKDDGITREHGRKRKRERVSIGF